MKSIHSWLGHIDLFVAANIVGIFNKRFRVQTAVCFKARRSPTVKPLGSIKNDHTMKTITILSFLTLLTSISFGQKKNASNYLTFYEDANTTKYFKMGNSTYLDYYLADKVKFRIYEYYVRIRKYSWGDTDTSYFREDDQNYYHFDPKVNSESIVMPKEIIQGQKWLEADSSWSYEVIGIDEKLSTPAKNYKGLIVIECVQLT